MKRLGCASSTSRIFTRYCCLSHCARGDHTAGPRRGIQQAKLDADRIRDLAHDAAQRVHLAHQVALGNAAHGGIAGHLGDQVQIQGEERGPQAHAGSRDSRLATGVTRAHDHHIVLFRKAHSRLLPDL